MSSGGGATTTLLEVRDLSVRFRTRDGIVQAVSNLSYTLRRGDTLGIVGESGSGKSVSNLATMGLLNRAYTQITRLLAELRQKTRMAIVLITHDLAVVADVCDRIIVMYAGRVVEAGSVDDIFYRPQHPYTRGLLASVPRLDRAAEHELHAIPGNPPNLLALPSGCTFRDRCREARDACSEPPPLWAAEGGRLSRCIQGIGGGWLVEAAAGTAVSDSAEPGAQP